MLLWKAKQFLKHPFASVYRCIQQHRWNRLSRQPVVAVGLGRGVTIEVDPRYHIARELWEGTFERRLRAFVEKTLREGMTVFDAGANIGYFTCLAAASVGNRGQVHAFEPGEYEKEALSRNVAINGFLNVVVNVVGLWETACVMEFQEYGHGMGAFSSFGRTKHAAVAEMTPRTRRVQTTSIDQYVKERRIERIDVLKMDIEGAELMAMRGAREVLSQNRCGTVICELCDATTEGCGYPARAIAAYLLESGFRLFELDASGRLRPHTLRAAYPYLELVAVR